jgi:ethanolamine utilization protein EutN
MFMARVVGTVWSTVKWDDLEGLKLLLVRPYHLDELKGEAAPTRLHDGVVVADILGAGVGEDVVIAYGHSARVGIEPHLPAGTAPTRPIDAAVVAIVDRYQVEPDEGAKE